MAEGWSEDELMAAVIMIAVHEPTDAGLTILQAPILTGITTALLLYANRRYLTADEGGFTLHSSNRGDVRYDFIRPATRFRGFYAVRRDPRPPGPPDPPRVPGPRPVG